MHQLFGLGSEIVLDDFENILLKSEDVCRVRIYGTHPLRSNVRSHNLEVQHAEVGSASKLNLLCSVQSRETFVDVFHDEARFGRVAFAILI